MSIEAKKKGEIIGLLLSSSRFLKMRMIFFFNQQYPTMVQLINFVVFDVKKTNKKNRISRFQNFIVTPHVIT